MAGEPFFVFIRLHHNNAATHSRVVGAAVFGTEKPIFTELCRPKPEGCITSWQHIVLDTKGRHKKTVDHILRGHYQLHSATKRHVKLVDLALSVRMFKLPHPLLADHGDLQRVARRNKQACVEVCPPGEHPEKQYE